jgi:hypothetical protein
MKHSLNPSSGHVQSDDVGSLMEHLKGDRFEYVDTAALRAHQEVLRRWTIVRELDACSGRDARHGGAAHNAGPLAAEENPIESH